MPNNKTAKKRVRQDARKALDNKAKKNKMKTEIKKLETLIENGEKDKIKTQLTTVLKAIDKAAKSNVIHDNTAARKKSNIEKKAHKALA